MYRRLRTWMPLFATCSAVGCAAYDTLQPGEYLLPAPTSVTGALARAGTSAEPPAETASPVKKGAPTTETTSKDGTDWVCDVQAVSFQKNPEMFTGVVGKDENIYPGALLQGSTLNDEPQPIPVARGGGVIYTNVSNGTQGTRKVLAEVTPSLVQDARNEIVAKLNDYGGDVQNPPSVTIETFDSEKELSAHLGVSTKFLGASVKASVDYSNEQRKSRIMLLLRQQYYTIFFEKPASPEAFFAASVTPEQLNVYTQPGNPPTYVNTVTYGRLLYVLYESESSKTELAAAVKATYGVTTVNTDVKTKNTLQNTTIKIIPVGGSSSQMNLPADLLGGAKGEEAFKSLGTFVSQQVAAGSKFDKSNPAQPIEYTIKEVASGKTVKMNLGLEYNVRNCHARVTSKAASLWLDANDAKVDAEQSVTAWPGKSDLRGGVLNSPSQTCWADRKRTINGHPAVSIDSTNDSAWFGGIRGLNCNFAKQSNYSVASVVQGAPRRVHLGGSCNIFGNNCDGNEPPAAILSTLGSSGVGPQQVLSMGPVSGSLWGTSHKEAASMNFSYVAAVPHVVITSFTSGAGTNAWIDGIAVQGSALESGDAAGKAFQGDATCVIGATTGESNLDCNGVKNRGDSNSGRMSFRSAAPLGVAMGEIVAFDHALSQPERRDLECSMGKRWGIAVSDCADGKPTESY